MARKSVASNSRVSRREFLLGSAGLVSALTLTACGAGGSGTGGSLVDSSTAASVNSNLLRQLPTLTSQNGLLDTNIRVALTTQQVGGVSYVARTYNGGVMGPVLKIKAGDRLRVHLQNDLPANPDPGPVLPANINIPHQFNTTNLHVHGLHVSPTAPSDDVLVSIDPGSSYQYQYDIPANQWEGTNWYHAHRHGATTTQVNNGMAGPLIVTGALDEVPEIAAAKEEILFIQDLRVQNGQALDFNTNGNVPTNLIVNGQVNPVIVMYPGEVQRWRVINATWFTTTRIVLEQHQFNKIALDGITLSAVTTAPEMVLSSGNRCDVLVQAQKPGTFKLMSSGYDQGFGSNLNPSVLATVIVLDYKGPIMSLPSSLPDPVGLDYNFPTIDNNRQLTLDYSFSPTFQPLISPAPGQPLQLFDPTRVDQTVNLNAAEEWTIVNNTGDEHPFHIHVNPFLVTKRNGAALSQPVWMDTIAIPPMVGSTPGSITFRTRFVDFKGTFVAHCHLLEHEDMGMMELVQVV